MLEKLSLRLHQKYNAFRGDQVTADGYERQAALLKLKEFIDTEAERNTKGELSSARVNFEISRYGILSREDAQTITEYAKTKGLSYYHRTEQNEKGFRYVDSYTVKSHVIGDQFGKSLSDIPFADQEPHSQGKLRALSQIHETAGNFVTAEQYERLWALQELKDFIDKNARKNERGQLSSARVNFEISRSGILSREDQAELAAYAQDKGIRYYHRDEQIWRFGRYQDESTVKSHVIGDQFGVTPE